MVRRGRRFEFVRGLCCADWFVVTVQLAFYRWKGWV
jgi:hypothetical protein